MKALNYVIIATLFTFLISSCTHDEPLNTTVISDGVEIEPIGEDSSCGTPDLGNEVCEVGVTDDLYSFATCTDDYYDDSKIPAFEYEGEIYEYEPMQEGEEAILALASVYFQAGLNNLSIDAVPVVRDLVNVRGFWEKLYKCVVKAVGVEDAKKLFKHLRDGTLTKKRAWRIAKRFIKTKFGPWGAAVTICELALCMA